ncbi:hypothetical protein NK553_26285 [Pseudomonas sp. ZM23]|uniref:Uncharacterized protein n=1 Tax=Pseudomonas triclosanedens TaxID=2961893 RepID=A0ABY6ZW17_9PSED|nr:hypothetical protein [Pseudomonas triclosanedens]MCP8467466.1 hypothetical protein [Pseudomonas triclosanedens]MCP8469834.1 hypothetical protein [Pseudomonas triclosanedens]MCP8478855.1 hypothetical protein [Pseudomonas triclosanedens]WAI49167.1 hypothetical protein OU419_26035 [Pseudomonas triclosanedens]
MPMNQISKRIYFLIISSLVFPLASTASEINGNLSPVASPLFSFGNYYEALRHVFSKGSQPDVVLTAHILPSMSKEIMVGIRGTPGNYEAFSIVPDQPVQLLVKKREFTLTNTKSDETGSEYKSKPISDSAAQNLIKLWELSITSARYNKNRGVTIDPTLCVFSLRTQWAGIISGEALLPNNSGEIKKLSHAAKFILKVSQGENEKIAIRGLFD